MRAEHALGVGEYEDELENEHLLEITKTRNPHEAEIEGVEDRSSEQKMYLKALVLEILARH